MWPKGLISVDEAKYVYFHLFSVKTTVHNTTADSHLYLASASAADSGTYACNVADMASARLSLHILNGESN